MTASSVPIATLPSAHGVRRLHALVLDSGTTSAYHVLRSVVRAGHRASFVTTRQGKWLRSTYDIRVLEGPSSDERTAFGAFLLNLVRNDAYDIVIACGDTETEILYEHRAMLGEHVRVFLPPDESCQIAFSKAKAYWFAQSVGVPTPRTHFDVEASELPSIGEALGFPLVVKGNRGSGGRHVRFAMNNADLGTAYSEVAALEAGLEGRPNVQEFSHGPGFVVQALFDRGKPVAVCAHQKMREYPLGRGVSSAAVTVRHAELEAFALKLLTHLAWDGLAKLDFIYDQHRGGFRFIELDPRVSASIDICRAAGVDLVELLCSLAAGRKPAQLQVAPAGVSYRWVFPRDILNVMHRPSLVMGLIGDAALRRSHFDLSRDDPWAGLLIAGASISYALRQLTSGELARQAKRADALESRLGQVDPGAASRGHARRRPETHAGDSPPLPAPSTRDVGRVDVEVVDGLSTLSDAELDAVTGEASVFLSRKWLRLVDAVDLEPIVGRGIRARFVVARAGGELVGLCPFFVATDASVRFASSFEKAFFTGLRSELERALKVSPRAADLFMKGLGVYRTALNAAGIRTDGWVLAVSPMTWRGGMPTARVTSDCQHRIRASMIKALQGIATQERLPLCLFCVPGEDTKMRATAKACGLEELFLSYNMVIPLEGSRFEDYIASLHSTNRRNKVRLEMKAVQKLGVTFRWVSDWAPLAEQMSVLYEQVYAKYGDGHLGLTPDFWRALSVHAAGQAEVLLAYRGDELVGFSALLQKGDGDVMDFHSGRVFLDKNDGLYFTLMYYERIRRAYALGAKRLWVGPGAFETKIRRGAVGHSMYGYMWMPTQRARTLLMPYLRGLSGFAERGLAHVGDPASVAS